MRKRVSSMKLVPLAAVLAIVFLPDLANAADFVPCSGTDCSACHFATMANTIVKWLIGVLIVVFAVVAATAGFGLVTSGGNPEAKSAAKQKMVNAVVGLIIVLAGWLLVDTILRGLLAGGTGTITYSATKILPWYTIDCQTQVPPQAYTEVMIETEPAPTTAPLPGQVRFLMSTGISATQASHKSGALQSYQACLEGKLEPGDYYITSVSDDQIAVAGKTFAYCAQYGCSHKAGSCHYGGASCIGSSYALDIRVSNLTATQISRFSSASKECGGYYLRHGPPDHIHTSIGQTAGCGCN